MSRFLDERGLEGLQRAGTALVPGGDGMPSFRDTACAKEVDRMIAYLPEADRRSFVGLMRAFRWLPVFVIRLILAIADRHRLFPGPLGGVLRQLRLGIFGAIYSLYYANGDVLRHLRWDAKAEGKAR